MGDDVVEGVVVVVEGAEAEEEMEEMEEEGKATEENDGTHERADMAGAEGGCETPKEEESRGVRGRASTKEEEEESSSEVSEKPESVEMSSSWGPMSRSDA